MEAFDANALNRIVSDASVGLIVIDLNLRYCLFNSYMEKLLGVQAGEVLGRKPSDVFPYLKKSRIEDHLKLAQQGQVIKRPDVFMKSNDQGPGIWIASVISPLRDNHGNIVGTVSVVTDVSHRYHTNAALRRVNELLVDLGTEPEENITRIIALAGELFEADHAFYNRIHGEIMSTVGHWNPPQDMPDKFPADGQICNEIIKLNKATTEVIRNLQDSNWADSDLAVLSLGLQTYIGHVIRVKDRPIGSLCTVFRHDIEADEELLSLLGILASAVGVEENRREAAQLAIREKKLTSLGLMAGGVAHDFNNLLLGILGNAELMENDLEDDSPLLDSLQGIMRAATRAAEITHQMLAYSGRSPLKRIPVSLDAAVKDAMQLIRIARVQGPSINFQKSTDFPFVLGDEGAISQVVLNLFRNAMEASSNHGRQIQTQVGVSGESLDLNDWLCPIPPEKPGRYGWIEVKDYGCGMDNNTLQQLFDPFFTSKTFGRGLGLASALGIIKSLKGFVAVKSQLDLGSVFRVFLPLTTPPDQIHSLGRKKSPPPDPLNARILLIEEDDEVRNVTQRLLTLHGANVDTVATGMEAIQKKGLFSNWDLILLDRSLHDVDGLTILQSIRSTSPLIPVILISGHEFSECNLTGEDPWLIYLRKPWSAGQLTTLVRAQLDRIRSLETRES